MDPLPHRPDPPPGARHLVVLVLDSVRWDSLMAADPRFVRRLGPVQRRWSYATWTAPSHYNLLMGLLPHASAPNVVASAVYKEELLRWEERLGLKGISFSEMIPRLWLPDHLRQTLGYETHAVVSLPVLNPQTPLAVGFDSFTLAPRHNDLGAIIDGIHLPEDRPSFWLINTGETHYPYATAEEPESEWPRLPGLHGTVRGLMDRISAGQPVHQSQAPRAFDQSELDRLRKRQVAAVRGVDAQICRLLDSLPAGTAVIVTSDHGELFGEGGYFGHGPIQHEKVMEVPLIEGRV